MYQPTRNANHYTHTHTHAPFNDTILTHVQQFFKSLVNLLLNIFKQILSILLVTEKTKY